jgi:hypothetical protein
MALFFFSSKIGNSDVGGFVIQLIKKKVLITVDYYASSLEFGFQEVLHGPIHQKGNFLAFLQ